MAVTEYKFPGTAANVNNGGYYAWSSVDNIKADDSESALVLTNATADKNPSDYLTATNFGFTSTDIPSGATINGIEFVINRKGSEADSQYDYQLYMLKDGTQHGDNLASATKWPTSLTDATYGGATSILGGTWAQTDIVGVTTFGFQLAIKNHIKSDGGEYTSVEHVKLRVYYTEAASGVTVNGTKQSLTLSAKTATINAAKNIAATCDSLSLTEYDATVTINSSVNVAAGTSALTLTENAADVNLNVSVGAGTDSLTLTGNAADVNLNVGVSAGTDALTLTEYAANVNAAVNVNASCAELTLTENSVTVGITGDVEVSAGVDSLTMTAYPANVNAAVNISSQLQELVLTKYAANVNAGIVVDCETATMTLSEYAATITATTAVTPINQGVVYLENLGGGLYYIKQVGG